MTARCYATGKQGVKRNPELSVAPFPPVMDVLDYLETARQERSRDPVAPGPRDCPDVVVGRTAAAQVWGDENHGV